MKTILIRPIQKQDNTSMAKVIRQVLNEFDGPKIGTASANLQLDCLFETYKKQNLFI